MGRLRVKGTRVDGEHQEMRKKAWSPTRVAIGAAGASLAVALCGVWLFRAPIAEKLLTEWFDARGIDATVDVSDITLSGVQFGGIALGEDASPTLTATNARVAIGWDWLQPRVVGIHLNGAEVYSHLTETGVSFGPLDVFRPPPSEVAFVAPAFEVEISGSRVHFETPVGPVVAAIDARGATRGDLTGTVAVAFTPETGAPLFARFGLAGTADKLTISALEPAAPSALTLSGSVVSPWGAIGTQGQIQFALADWSGLGLLATGLEGVLSGHFGAEPTARGVAFSGAVARLELSDAALQGARFEGSFQAGAQGDTAGALTLKAEALDTPIAQLGDVQVLARLEVGGTIPVEMTFARGRLSEDGQTAMERGWLRLPGSPMEPLLRDALARSQAAGWAFSGAVGLQAVRDESAWRLVLQDAPVQLSSASGEDIVFTPARGAAVALDFGSQTFTAAGVLSVNDRMRVELASVSFDAKGLQAKGTVALPAWEAAGARFSAPEMALLVETTAAGRTFRVQGDLRTSGPFAGGMIEGLRLPNALAITTPAAGGLIISAEDGRCMSLGFDRYTLPGVRFEDGVVAGCPLRGPALMTAAADGTLSGGVRIEDLIWSGQETGAAGAPASLRAGRIDVAFTDTLAAPGMAATLIDPAFLLTLSAERTVGLSAPDATARFRVTDGSWRIDGTFDGVTAIDQAAPALITEGVGTWIAVPQGDGVLIEVHGANARVQDAFPIEKTPRFNPLRLTDLEANLESGVARLTSGGVALEAGMVPLGRITATHALADASGSGQFVADNLVFSRNLTPAALSGFALGLIIGLEGTVDATVDARWQGAGFLAQADVDYDLDSVSTQSLPVIRGVKGQIHFDDLFAFTTPPGQTVSLAVVNPGVALENGVVRFQLLEGARVALEDARWRFAGGELTLEPGVVQLGTDSSIVNLTLAEVDISTVLASLKLPDLTMTGRVEGRFPVELTKTAAWIRGGRLTSVGGGTIQYTGQAGAAATGISRLAFDALKDFRYSNFEATLNGNLADKVDIGLQFSGLTVGEDLDLSSIVPLPGGQTATAPDVPFRFNVSINAPFSSLMDTAAGIADARRFARPGLVAPEQTPVDPEAPPQPPQQ